MYYVYSIQHKITKQWYVGVKFGKNSDPTKFWKPGGYFTSSKVVHRIIEDSGSNIFIPKIRKIFTDKLHCIKYEKRLLFKIKPLINNKILNIDNNQLPHKAIQNQIKTIFIKHISSDTYKRWPADKTIPIGFIKQGPPKSNNKNRNLRWFYNKQSNISGMYKSCPGDDWALGRGPSYKSNSQTLKNKNLVWATDGVTNILVHKDFMPDSFIRGRFCIKKPSGIRHYKYKWITDGKISKQIREDEPIPLGYKRGKTFLYKKHDTSKQVYFKGILYSSVKQCCIKNNLSRFKLIKEPTFKYVI